MSPAVWHAEQGREFRLVFQVQQDTSGCGDGAAREGVGIVHALTGPVFINGAKAGDVLAVTIEALEPADVVVLLDCAELGRLGPKTLSNLLEAAFGSRALADRLGMRIGRKSIASTEAR